MQPCGTRSLPAKRSGMNIQPLRFDRTHELPEVRRRSGEGSPMPCGLAEPPHGRGGDGFLCIAPPESAPPGGKVRSRSGVGAKAPWRTASWCRAQWFRHGEAVLAAVHLSWETVPRSPGFRQDRQRRGGSCGCHSQDFRTVGSLACVVHAANLHCPQRRVQRFDP
jgi:hypothetical protein